MNRKTVYGALIAGALLAGPALPSAVAFADQDDSTTPVEVTELLDEDDTGDMPHAGDTGETSETGSAPQGQAGPKYGPNIDGWVVRVKNVTPRAAYPFVFVSPGFTDNVASMSPSAGSQMKDGQTGTVKGTPSAAFSAVGGKAPANMNFKVKAAKGDLAFDVTVRDSAGYDAPANVGCVSTGFDGSLGSCKVVSNAKNKEIEVQIFSDL